MSKSMMMKSTCFLYFKDGVKKEMIRMICLVSQGSIACSVP